VGNCLKIVTKSQGEEKPLLHVLYTTKGRDILLFQEKIILPQRGKDVPHAETTAGKVSWRFLDKKINSTFSTSIKRRVTQLGIV
jgi:hypothetical protein